MKKKMFSWGFLLTKQVMLFSASCDLHGGSDCTVRNV